MSTALYGTPISSSTSTVAAEKPHIGNRGVPFMYTTTVLARTSRSISSSTSLIAPVSPLGGDPSRCVRPQRQGVDRSHQIAERLVHEAVLIDEPEAGERRCRHVHLEVIAGAGR